MPQTLAPVPVRHDPPRPVVDRAYLLAGGLRPSPLSEELGHSVIDLWLKPRQTVMDLWVDALDRIGLRHVGVLWNDSPIRPSVRPRPDATRVDLIQDASPYRGPGGALRDACAGADADSTLLVGEAARLVGADLSALVRGHADAEADITIACNPDRSPAGLYLLRRRTLDLIPSRGFMDIKEQWLTRAVDAGYRVFVHTLGDGWSYVLHTREQFLRAVRAANSRDHQGDRRATDAERRVVCDRAIVHDTAHVSDSIVMGDATVGPEAVVVRSLIGPGVHVQAGAVIVDRVISNLRHAAGPSPRRD